MSDCKLKFWIVRRMGNARVVLFQEFLIFERRKCQKMEKFKIRFLFKIANADARKRILEFSVDF